MGGGDTDKGGETVEGQEDGGESQLANSLTYSVFGRMSCSVSPLHHTVFRMHIPSPPSTLTLCSTLSFAISPSIILCYLLMFIVHCLTH